MKKITLYITLLLIIIFNSYSYSQETQETLGEKLVKEFWSVLKSGEIDSYAGKISDDFITLHQTGAGRKSDEIKLIRTIKLNHYTLSDFIEVETGNIIIVTYKVTGDEELGGKKLKPAYRMSVWQKENDIWKFIAHCNMAPLLENKK